MEMWTRWIRSWSKRKRIWNDKVSSHDSLEDSMIEPVLIRARDGSDWDSACSRLVDLLDLPEDAAVPPFPKANVPAAATTSTNAQKRKATDDDDVEMTSTSGEGETDKRTKLDGHVGHGEQEGENGNTDASTAAALASFFGVLDQASMEPPTQPTKEELDVILLDVRKRSLLAEYGV